MSQLILPAILNKLIVIKASRGKQHKNDHELPSPVAGESEDKKQIIFNSTIIKQDVPSGFKKRRYVIFPHFMHWLENIESASRVNY